MAMEMKLNLKMVQKLVMTPMLQQAIKLLPLARLELAQLIRQEMVENPVLEELLEEETEKEEDTEESNLEDTIGNTQVEPGSEKPESPVEQEMDWDNYFQDNIDRGMSAGNYTERPGIEATYNKEASLADHLMWQLNLSVDSDEDKFIGICIIGNIQNDGYCISEIGEIAEISNAREEDVLRVLKVIQTFEPVGVGARSLKECLLIQARSQPNPSPLIEILIEKHLEKLDEKNFQKIANEHKTTVQKIIGAVKEIKTFDPKPGLKFSSEGIDYVTPDIIVIKTKEGYDVALNNEGIPKIQINPFYQNLLKTAKEAKTKEYLETKYRSALWLIKSIDQRQQTIYKVGKSIVKMQTEFLDQGLAYLKPMVLRDVAQDIEMHESTVSRITTNKYIDTPQGIFELKFFFHSGIKSYLGTNNLSSVRVKDMIREIISSENPKKPYTDDELVEILMRKDAKIARRTVTKYRKELNISSASKRKKIY